MFLQIKVCCQYISSLSLSLSLALCASLYPVGLLWLLFFARFLFFSICPFCCFHITPPSWMHPCSSLCSPPFLHFSLAPHGMLSLGAQKGDVLKTLTGDKTLRETEQCSPVDASILSASRGPSGLDLPR